MSRSSPPGVDAIYTDNMTDRKYKIPNYQNGHAYLTSHRVCYVAAEEPRKYAVGIDLKEIDRAEYQVGAPALILHEDDY